VVVKPRQQRTEQTGTNAGVVLTRVADAGQTLFNFRLCYELAVTANSPVFSYRTRLCHLVA
jgi:hypothetical protein